MYPCDVKINVAGNIMLMHSSETVFQALKCKNPDDIKLFLNLNGYEAKKLGKKVALHSDWEEVKLDVMRYAIKCKFTQNSEIAEKLKAFDGEIVEENTWHDTFWGVHNGIGYNWLGKLLMETHDEMRG